MGKLAPLYNSLYPKDRKLKLYQSVNSLICLTCGFFPLMLENKLNWKCHTQDLSLVKILIRKRIKLVQNIA